MPKYRILKGYERKDSTLMIGDEEKIEYPIGHDFSRLFTAKDYFEYLAKKEGMTINKKEEGGFIAKKEKETMDEESGIETLEKEWLRIEFVFN